MHLGKIIPLANNIRVDFTRQKSPISSLESGKGVFYEIHDLYSEKDYEYYVLLINLFDRAMISNNLHVLSIEQEELLALYFKEANTITPEDTVDLETYIYDYSLLSRHIDKLDEFLGSYLGENDGRYAKYGKKQFHSKCKHFSTASQIFTGV